MDRVIPLKTRLLFSRINKNVYREYPARIVLRDYSYLLNDNVKCLENHLTFYFNQPENESKVNKVFAPSKTAQNGLNFLSKEDEAKLIKEDFSSLPAHQEIISSFKIILILLKQNYEIFEDNELPKALLTIIMKKFKIESLSKINFF